MFINFSAPKSEPNPASVTTISDKFLAVSVANIELQPWAILAKGPPWTRAGVPSIVWTKFGLIASLSIKVNAPSTFKSETVIGLWWRV